MEHHVLFKIFLIFVFIVERKKKKNHNSDILIADVGFRSVADDDDYQQLELTPPQAMQGPPNNYNL
jgi:hypothetical protein